MMGLANLVTVDDKLVLASISAETDNHTMDGGNTTRFVVPFEGTIGEIDLDVDPPPQRLYLFSLRY